MNIENYPNNSENKIKPVHKPNGTKTIKNRTMHKNESNKMMKYITGF